MFAEPLMVPVQAAIEYAFAAYRYNSGYKTVTDVETKTFANKDLVGRAIRLHVGVSANFEYSVVPTLKVTDEDRENASKIDEHFKKYMFKSLAGKLGQFENDIYTAICGEKVSVNKSGLIAYIPELIKRDLERWNFEKTLKTVYKDSKVSTENHVKGNMTILDVRKIRKDFDSFTIVIAGMNGNLYQFYKKEMTADAVGKQYNINGKVKKGDVEYNTKIPLTVINYVKVAPCRNR